MDFSSLITGTGAVAVLTINVYDFKKKEVKKNGVKAIALTTLSTVATATVGGTLNYYTMEQIHQKYSSAYVESLSDEELERALVQMDLLETNLSEKDIKSL